MCFVCMLAKQHSAFKCKNAILGFVSPGSAEALVRLGWKMKYHLTAYFLATFLPKIIKIVRCTSELQKAKAVSFFGTQ